MSPISSHLKTRRLMLLLSVVYSISLFSCRQAASPPPGGQLLKSMTAFEGGKFEASGVTSVAGTNGVLFVDNGKGPEVFWMGIDQNGKQVGAIKPIGLGVDIEDIEGITTDGTYFYVVSSQSRPKAIGKVGIVRFKLDIQSQSVQAVESISGLKSFLVANVAELRGEGDRKGKDGGLNIEGVAWDPRGRRLLLGLRSPIVEGNALLVPLRLRDPGGAFSIDNLEVQGAKAIRLSLGALGIRGIEYDDRSKVFRIISGASEDQEQADFGFWEWNGNEKEPVLRELNRFDGSVKPEGVARVSAGGRDFIFVVFDAGGYTVLN